MQALIQRPKRTLLRIAPPIRRIHKHPTMHQPLKPHQYEVNHNKLPLLGTLHPKQHHDSRYYRLSQGKRKQSRLCRNTHRLKACRSCSPRRILSPVHQMERSRHNHRINQNNGGGIDYGQYHTAPVHYITTQRDTHCHTLESKGGIQHRGSLPIPRRKAQLPLRARAKSPHTALQVTWR